MRSGFQPGDLAWVEPLALPLEHHQLQRVPRLRSRVMRRSHRAQSSGKTDSRGFRRVSAYGTLNFTGWQCSATACTARGPQGDSVFPTPRSPVILGPASRESPATAKSSTSTAARTSVPAPSAHREHHRIRGCLLGGRERERRVPGGLRIGERHNSYRRKLRHNGMHPVCRRDDYDLGHSL